MPIQIVNACHRKWESLEGTGQVRYCDDCKLHVHDLSLYPEALIEQRIASQERFCGAMTSPAPARRTFVSLAAAWIAAVPLFAQERRVVSGWKVTLLDATDAVIAGATASLRLPDQSILLEAKSDASGEITMDFTWQPGLELFVDVLGFYPSRQPLISPPVEPMRITLQVGNVIMGGTLVAESRGKLFRRRLNRFFRGQ